MITGFDHVALPMADVDAMLGFYESLGATLIEEVPGFLHSAYFGANKINLHLPAAWQSTRFTLRGPAAKPGCGDLCLIWQGDAASATAHLQAMGVAIEEGPVTRRGGQARDGTSVYCRDPDQNLIELICYP